MLAFTVKRDGFLQACGDEHRVIVFRSRLVPTDGRMYAPVREHIEAHGMVLADCDVVDAEKMMGGTAIIEWLMTKAARRDGLANLTMDLVDGFFCDAGNIPAAGDA